jgi:Holliday junction resolvase-like predicted endonuclease
MSNYRRGTRYEKKTRAWLEEQGYWVIEARGSHGAADLIALSDMAVLVVQVKSGRKLSTGERAEMLAKLLKVPVPVNGRRQIVTWTKYDRRPQVEDV